MGRGHPCPRKLIRSLRGLEHGARASLPLQAIPQFTWARTWGEGILPLRVNPQFTWAGTWGEGILPSQVNAYSTRARSPRPIEAFDGRQEQGKEHPCPCKSIRNLRGLEAHAP